MALISLRPTLPIVMRELPSLPELRVETKWDLQDSLDLVYICTTYVLYMYYVARYVLATAVVLCMYLQKNLMQKQVQNVLKQ